MKNYIIILIAFVSASLLVSSCGTKAETTPRQTPGETIPVKVISLVRTKTQPAIHTSGQLTTDDETYLSFKTGGIIRSILVKEGDRIRKGQVLATLDLTEIKAQVSQARSAFEKAKRDNARVSRLYKDSVATLEQFQNSQTGLEIAENQMGAAEFNLSFSEIRALTDGYVLKKFASEGQVINPGSSVLLTNGAGKGSWILRCGVGDRDWASISINDPAKITVDAFPNESYNARITRKAEGVDAVSGSFIIEMTMDGKAALPFAAGMFGKAVITPTRQTEAWMIPFDALLDGDAENGFVFITNDGKTAKKVSVKVAGITNDQVRVIEGLEAAKSLIISGSAYLTDSSSIEVIK